MLYSTTTTSPLFRKTLTTATLHHTKDDDNNPNNNKKKKKKSISIWVNPNNNRFARLADHLSTLPYDSIPQQLNSTFSQQDKVTILNHVRNPHSALSILHHFLQQQQQTTTPHDYDYKRALVLYNVCFKVLSKCRDWTAAHQLFNEMLCKGIKPDNITFSTLIGCARSCNFPDMAIQLYERMVREFHCEPDDVTNSAMIHAYRRLGDTDKALELYERAKAEKWRVDALMLPTVIKIYAATGDFDAVLGVYEDMKRIGVDPNVVSYNALLDAMGRARRPWLVKTHFKEMESKGILPNRATYAALLRAYARARYAEDALNVYKDMKDKHMELNVVLYNTLLAMCAHMGLVDQALEIFKDMKASSCKPDSWTFSSLITIYSCCGKVSEAEGVLIQMSEVGLEPNIFVVTSLIQCYGKARQTDDVVRMLDRVMELDIKPDEQFCGCLLNVMTLTPKEELEKAIGCVERANSKVGSLVRQLVDVSVDNDLFKREAEELFTIISDEVKKAYCNCLIDICVNLNMLERACVLLEVGLKLGIYTTLHSKSSTQWSLHVKSLSLGAALTALHVWMNDLARAMEGEELPPLLGIHTGHGKHKYSERGLASVFESHLGELNAPFHESVDKSGWFLTTKDAAETWLRSRTSSPDPEVVTA